MAKRLPAKDVVIIGLGWTGAILAEELTRESLEVVAIERGPWRDTATDFPTTYAPDELREDGRHDIFARPAQSTLTFRNSMDQTALPVRTWGSFLPPNGLGGGGVHWNAETWRFLPSDFVLRTHLTKRYGAKFIPADMTIQDWGVTYDELEPHFDQFEYLCGTAGKAGNLEGVKQPGGNPFEGSRSREYPTPPQPQPYGPALFQKAATEMGYHPFPQPSGNMSQAYTNPLGVTLGPCTYCGFCEHYGCGNYSKASPQTTILPVLVRRPNFEARTHCEVTRINLDNTRKRATGVTYVDAQGQEWEQPADLVILAAFMLWNVQMLLISGIGQPYDPVANTGVIGRNYSYQVFSNVRGWWPGKNFNPFVASGAIGTMIDDFNGDNFDHGPLGFVGGGYMGAGMTNGRPIYTDFNPPGTPKWGAAWKQATRENYLSTYSMQTHASQYSRRQNYLDLDPAYKDPLGRPLMRMTFDFSENDHKVSAFSNAKLAEIARAMGAKEVKTQVRSGHYTMVEYQTTHTCGGAIMGTDPKTSALNRYLQSWDVSNLFVTGNAAFPQNGGYNPTGTIGALTYWTAKALRERYLKSPGPLVKA